MHLLSRRQEAASDANRQSFYKLLSQSQVIVPSKMDPHLKTGQFSLLLIKDFPYQSISMLSEEVLNTDNEAEVSTGQGFLAFTSLEAFKKWYVHLVGSARLADVAPEVRPLSMKFTQLCTQALYLNLDFILLNPVEENTLLISLYEIYHLAEGLIPPSKDEAVKEIVLEKDTEIYLGVPVKPPSPMLVERLYGLFKQKASIVSKAYLFQIAIAQGPPHLAVGIHMVPEKASSWELTLLPDTMAVIHEVLDERDCVDLFLLNHDEGMESLIRSFSEPFFQAELSL